MTATMKRTPKAPYAPRIEVGQLITRVQSERDPALYYEVSEHGTSCSCPGFQYRQTCKHLALAAAAEDAFDARLRGGPGVCLACGREVAWRSPGHYCAICLATPA